MNLFAFKTVIRVEVKVRWAGRDGQDSSDPFERNGRQFRRSRAPVKTERHVDG